MITIMNKSVVTSGSRRPTTWPSSHVHQRSLEQLFLEDKQTFKRCPRLCQAPCKDHLSCCWIILAALSNRLCAGRSACKVRLFAISFLCHVSALKSPVSFSPLPLALFSSECFSKLSLAQARISRTPKTEGREPNSSGGETAAAGDGAPHRGKTNLNISGLFKISRSCIYSSASGCSD